MDNITAGAITYIEKQLSENLKYINEEYYHFCWTALTVLLKIANYRELSREQTDLMIMSVLGPEQLNGLFNFYDNGDVDFTNVAKIIYKIYSASFDLTIIYRDFMIDKLSEDEFFKKESDSIENIKNAYEELKKVCPNYEEKWAILINQACNVLKIKVAGMKALALEEEEEKEDQ